MFAKRGVEIILPTTTSTHKPFPEINQLIVNTGARGTELPPTFLNFLFTYLFLIKIYFFIISSLFPQFNLFVLVL
jgi:hypothetical protein